MLVPVLVGAELPERLCARCGRVVAMCRGVVSADGRIPPVWMWEAWERTKLPAVEMPASLLP